MKKTLVVHPYPGIGDLIWHIPYIRAIAQQSLNGRVSVLARPACRAADVLSAEACVEEIIEDDYKRRNRSSKGRHDGTWGKIRLATELRKKRFDRIIIFSDRNRYAVIATLAGIRERAGYGFRLGQRLWLNRGPYISPYGGRGSSVYDQASKFAVAHGYIDHPVTPKVIVPPSLLAEAANEICSLPRPCYAFAIGASESGKNWGATKFAELAKLLINDGCGVIFLGGPAEREAAEKAFTPGNGLRADSIRVICQPSVMKSAAILAACDFTIGNDTGVLNLSVACDVPALGLFGSTLPLQHDPLMHSISASSMEAISVEQVFERLVSLRTANAYGRRTTP
jgi:heptosyltransferase-2